MVLFKASAVHFSTMMCLMNQLRQVKTLCDITLTVGTARIPAHMCILVAGSRYFEALFLGDFKEAAMNDISMTEVTDNKDALEMIVSFIYTGEIDINSDNLGIIVKLACFFLIETLREFCIEFMTSTLFLETCLQYYFFAVDYGLSDIEAKTASMVQSRFHDYLIFEEDTLKMSPDELMYISSKNIFEHCTSMSLLQFIARWVEKGLTEKHVTVGTAVLDVVNSRVPLLFSSDYCKTPSLNLFDRVKSSLDGHETKSCDKFLRLFKRKLTRLSTQTTTERKSYNLRSQQSNNNHFHVVEKEVAIITFSPRPCVVETFKKKKEEQKRDASVTEEEMGDSSVTEEEERDSSVTLSNTHYTEPIMDMCAYVPRTRCWYHMHELMEDDLPITLVYDDGYSEWKFETLHDDLAFIQDLGETFRLYNVKSNTWRSVAFEAQIIKELEGRDLT